jgi:Tol biopolymer transport system component
MEIWICDADGSDPVQLTSFGGPMTGSPQWSPDGTQVVFDSRATGDSALYSIGPQGGPPRGLETGVADSSLPAWSPDGRFLYFTGVTGTTSQIFRRQAESGPALQITRGGATIRVRHPTGAASTMSATQTAASCGRPRRTGATSNASPACHRVRASGTRTGW